MTEVDWVFGSWAITTSTLAIAGLAIANLIGTYIENHITKNR
jgi:hypothetical protein